MERNLEIHLKPAIIWHLQNLVKNLTNKMMSTSLPEFDKVLEQSPDGEEYRTHLVRILLKEIDFQGNRQKESVKINLLKPNLQKIMESPYFLSHYVFEIFLDVKDIADFYGDILRHLKLKVSEQLIFCLGIYIFSMNSKDAKSIKILKQKLKEWFEFEKDGELPSYAVYQILNAIKSEPELSEDTTFSMNIREFLVQQNVKSMKEESMNAQKLSSIFECNRTNSLYKYENETKNNTEFKFVEKCSNTHQVLEPWQVLIDLGPSISNYESALLFDVLKDFSKTSLRGLAHTLIALSNHFTANDREKNLETITMKCNMKGDMTYMNENPAEYEITEQQWNLDELSKAFKEVYQNATWIELIKFLDVDTDAREEFYFQSQNSFDVFMKIWNSLKPPSKSFPVEFLIANSWKNKRAQVTCLEYAINYSYQNADIPFEKAKRRQDHNKQLQGIKPSVATFSRIWNCIDLVQTLVNLSDSNYFNRVKNIFEPALKSNPEYLLLTLIKIKTKNGRFLLEDMYSQLLPIFLTGHPNSIPILNEVWSADKNIVINSISSLYSKNQKSMNLSRVLDICQSIKNSLLQILETCKDYNFTIQLALLAAKRDFLHFERSIEKMIQAEGDPLFHALFKYIYANLIIPIENSNADLKKREEIVERSLLSEERLQIIVDKLIKFKDQNPDQVDFITRKKFEEIYMRLVKIFSNIQTEEHPNNELIEEKGNEYFQQLYKGQKSVEDLVKIMKDFRSSSNSTEREIYACMVQNLFDEWKFFPKYPKKELEMTAKLFGKIMSERKIIDGVVTDIGLKCIVEGLKREGKMFLFSITALEECKNSVEHENGLKNILSCQQLQEKKPDLYQHILRRYHQLHSNTEPQKPQSTENKPMKPQNTMGDMNRLNQPMKRESIPASNTPDQRPPMESGFNPNLQRQNKPKNPNTMASTPTQPGKYFTPDQNVMGGWKPQGQMGANRNLYPPGNIPPSMSTRLPQDNFSLGPSADSSTADKRSLNPLSRKFMPKTQQVQEYLKKDEMKLPSEFMDNLITILNMTGTDQIYGKAQELESQMKDEYVEKMAHFTVVKRVTDADEKRIQFYSDFFYSMKNRNIVNSLIKECIQVILRIITTEIAEISNRNEISRAASNPVKNVSLFLGYLTIRHERALLLTELDLKQLLIEAETKRCMVSAMIVVCKILRVGEASDFRGVFNRYNPWMQGLYSLLVEYKKNFCQLSKESDKIIYNEIQLVLKNTQLNENQIRESTLFRDLSNKETRNNELNHILRKIANSPYIVVPEISEEDGQEGEDCKEEDLQNMPDDFNSERVNIDETSEKFPNIDPKILKSLVIRGINYAMKEIIDAVIRRVIPIASITTRSLVLKDFALETDPSKLKSAAEITSKSLAGMLALITCKDILKYQFMKSLKDLVYSSQSQQVRSLDDQGKKELIELLSKENSEIGCKQIIDEVKKQALSNIEKDDSINQEIANRQKYQHDGIEFRDLSVLHQYNRLPEILRPQEAGLTDPEYQVYQDYDGIEDMIESVLEDPDEIFKAPEEENPYSGQMNQAQKSTIDRVFHLCKLFLNKGNVRDYEATLRNEIEQIRAYIQSDNAIEDLISENILAVENISFNPNLLIFLIESKVVSLSSWEKRFAFFINGTPMNFSKPSIIEFMEMFIIRGILEKKLFTNEDIPELYSIIESYSSSQNNVASTKWNCIKILAKGDSIVSNSEDVAELCKYYFDQWCNSVDKPRLLPMFNHKIGNVFKNSQDMKMFIKHCLISAVERDEDQSGVLYSYSKLDNFVQLIIGCSFNWIRNPSGFTLKNVIEDGEVLEIISHPDLLENSSSQQTYTFDQIPFKRILSAFTNHFFTLFHEEEKDNLEKMQKKNQILEMFSNVFKEMNPSRYPGFAFAWVELISSPAFMPMMLTGKNEHNLHERWFKMHELFNKLFGFLKENIYENCSTTPALEKLFEGTLKLCLVVLHDYPEFLCYYYFEFINHLPLYQTVNLRNMILAAYPKEMRLPDPININIESFPESTSIYTKDRQSHLQNYIPDSEYYAYKADLDKYLANPEDETLLSICKRIEQNQKVKEYRRIINTGLVHSTILYLTYDIEEIKTVEKLENPKLSQKFIFMCRNLSTPVRDILLNCMFDELRLLNKSTVFFMNALLQVFKAKGEHDKIIRSQICRILSDRGLKINKQQFERQKSQRIQPWGLLAFTARITNEEEFKNIANN